MPRGNSDGDVVIDILLDGEKAKQYWESFSSYMSMSTKQLEKNLTQSAKRIAEMETRYGEISAKLKELRGEKLGLQFEAEQFDEAQRKILQVDEAIRKLTKERERLILLGNYPRTQEEEQTLKTMQQQIDSLKEQRNGLKENIQELQNSKLQFIEINQQIEELKAQRKEVYEQAKQENQEFEQMNERYVKLTKDARDVEKATKDTAQNTKEIKKHTAHIGSNLKSGISKLANGLKKILRISLALVGIRSLYSGISGALRTWLNSEDELAKKTKANLENLKMNFAQILQPALQWVLNIFNNILAVLGAVVKQFTNLNIFSNQLAKSTKKTSKNANNMLASFDKLDVLQKNTGQEQIQPTDMTKLMTKYEDLAKRIKVLIETLFDPFQKAWEEKGQGVLNSIETTFNNLKGLAGSIGNSIFEVWTNGTVETAVKTILGVFDNILKTIGNIAGAWENAWKKDNAGTNIVQNLADALNGVLKIVETMTGVIEKITAGQGYQTFVNAITKGMEVLSGIVKYISETWSKMFEEQSPKWVENFNKIFGNIGKVVDKIVKKVKEIIEDDEFREKFETFVGTLGKAFTILTDWWVILSDILVLMVDPSWENVGKLGEDFGTMGEDAKGLGENLNKLTGAIDKVQNAFNFLKKAVEVIAKILHPIGFVIVPKIREEIQKIDWKGVGESIGSFFENIYKSVLKFFGATVTFISEKAEDVKRTVPPKFEEMKSKIITKFEELKKNAPKKFEEIQKSLVTITNNTLPTIIAKYEELKKKIPQKIQELQHTLATIFPNVANTLVTILDKKLPNVVGSFSTMIQNIRNKFSELGGLIQIDWTVVGNNIWRKTQEIVGYITTPFAGLGSTLNSMLWNVWGTIKSPLNALIGGFNDLVNRLSKALNDVIWRVNQVIGNSTIQRVAGWVGLGGSIPYLNENVWIPRLAKGGIVTQATPAIIGEAGAEAVMPLENNTEWIDMLAERLSGNQNITIKFEGNLSQLGRILKPVIDKENRRIGSSFVVGGNG